MREAWEPDGWDSAVTLTFGIGPGVFNLRGLDPQRLRQTMPVALQPLPAFTGDSLEPDLYGGDLCVQACAQDEQAASTAVDRAPSAPIPNRRAGAVSM